MKICNFRTRIASFCTLLGLALLCISPAQANYAERAEVQTFIDEMVSKHDYSRDLLQDWFRAAQKQTQTIEAMERPAEAKPWHEYRKIFLTEKRISNGVRFWQEHRETLQQAEARWGVPPEIITAIIGVETFYGKFKGKFPAFDTLVTLAFDYPKRAAFFRKELEQFLLLIREEGVVPKEMPGSYAAAFGMPQFISSSYRHYAVDFDGDGRRDIINNITDAIGSVANYFTEHGWKPGEPITVTASRNGSKKQIPDLGMKPKEPVSKLSQYGLYPTQPVKASQVASIIELEQPDGMEYWLGLHNFYVITRYNHSNLYAMAVYQLSQEILQRMQQSG